MTRTRKPADVRKEELLAAALKLAQLHGIKGLTREDIAREAQTANSLVSHHFGTMKQLHRALVRHAIKHGNVIVTAQAVAGKHLKLEDVPEALRPQVSTYLAMHG